MKTIIIALVFFILGFGVYWGYNRYQTVMEENARLRKLTNEVPASPIEPTPTLEPGLEPEKKPVGSIEGSLSYPSEGIPPLEVVAFDSTDGSVHFTTKTTQNQGTYTLENVPTGTYIVVAYATEDYGGGYTEAVPCGLSVLCNDHTLIKVKVNAGETTKGVDLKDWYAPANTFPKKPVQ